MRKLLLHVANRKEKEQCSWVWVGITVQRKLWRTLHKLLSTHHSVPLGTLTLFRDQPLPHEPSYSEKNLPHPSTRGGLLVY
jgi:hypothetical protein